VDIFLFHDILKLLDSS